jgi:hypothetical protein
VEDQTQGAAPAAAELAHPVAQGCSRPPPCAADGAVACGEHRGLPLLQGRHGRAGLGSWPLFDHHELAAGEVLIGPVETDDDLEGEDQLAVQVLVRAFQSPGP